MEESNNKTMKHKAYRKLRESIGTRDEVGKLVQVHPKTLSDREYGRYMITKEAELALRWLLHKKTEDKNS